MNHGEGWQLAERMRTMGHEPVDSVDDADIIILNTCTVVEPTEKKMIKRMGELRRSGKKVVVTGCMAKAQPNRIMIRLPDSVILPPNRYCEFDSIIKQNYGCGEMITTPDYKTSCIIPIAQGCLGNCSYCITKIARGDLSSFPENEILERFDTMIKNGVREVLVTAQDTACYGLDKNTDLAELIEKMLLREGEYRIRIGMMNPNGLEPILDKLLDAIKDPRVYKFFHMPVQSGSNEVLKNMKRHYTAERFMDIVHRIRNRYPDVSIATDMIVGFPGETDEDFEKSLNLMKELKADTINITRFSARPGTDATSMKQVHGRISAERSAEMTKVKNEIEYRVNHALIGKRYKVLVTESGKDNTVIARTENYRPVVLENDVPLGKFLEVTITECASTYLTGKRL